VEWADSGLHVGTSLAHYYMYHIFISVFNEVEIERISTVTDKPVHNTEEKGSKEELLI